jgi:hypothetical protein
MGADFYEQNYIFLFLYLQEAVKKIPNSVYVYVVIIYEVFN